MSNKFFSESSPRSDRSDSPSRRSDSPLRRPDSPCRRKVEKYYPDEAGRALEKRVKEDRCADLDRFEHMERQICELRKESRCFQDKMWRQVKCLEKAACEQKQFDKRTLFEIEAIRCRLEKLWERTLLTERATVGGLEVVQAQLEADRIRDARERVTRNEDVQYLADRLAGLEVSGTAATIAQNQAGDAGQSPQSQMGLRSPGRVAAAAALAPVGYPGYGVLPPPIIPGVALGPTELGFRGPCSPYGRFETGIGYPGSYCGPGRGCEVGPCAGPWANANAWGPEPWNNCGPRTWNDCGPGGNNWEDCGPRDGCRR